MKRQPEADFIVEVSDTEISCRRPDGTVERVTVAELQGILIETTSDGPFVPDVFWILVGTSGGCVIPQGATGESVLLERLQKLPGFDNEALIQAMGSTDDRKFLCWERKK